MENFYIDALIQHLEQFDLCCSRESVVDLDTKVERFNDVISSLLDEIAPVQNVTLRERSKAHRLERKFENDKRLNHCQRANCLELES